MADAELVKFTKALEKLSVDCGSDVKKLLASCHNSINSRMTKLMDDMENVAVPNCPAADLDKVPQVINAILKRESSKFASICVMSASLDIDKPGGKVSVAASGVSGPMALM